MNPRSKGELSPLLSSYLDGELDEVQRREVEAIVAQDPAAHNELEQLKALRGLLASKRGMPPSLGFWTRVSSELERRKKEEENLFPFPRKYQPLAAVAAAVAVIAGSIFLFQQRSAVVNYVSRQSERVQKAVESNVLQGSIMPLFSHIDKNQALQFAMFGTLPLDANAQTELRVNEDSVKGYSIDVNTKGARRTPPVTVKEFVDEVRPTTVQLQIIDSLLDLGRAKLERSVLIKEDRAMAVDPQLSRLNRVMLSGIAASLEPLQRARFERFLQVRRAPYMLSGGQRGAESSERVLHALRAPEGTHRYFVVTPDTVLVSHLQIDMDSLRWQVEHMEGAQPNISVHVNSLIRRFSEREVALRQRLNVQVPQVRVVGDSDFFSIQIGNNWEGMPALPRETWVKPRMPVPVEFHRRQGGQLFNFQFSGPDSSFNFGFELDSLLIQMQQESGGAGFEIFNGDPQSRNGVFRFDFGRMKQMIDSAVVANKRPRSKLDSLMLEMEKRERLREQNQREKDPQDLPRF